MHPPVGGNDGPDDAAENFLNWTMLYALGAPASVLEIYKKAWEGHLRQYTEAKTVEVPLAREGMYYKEFPVMFDWFHNGEGFSAFYLEGLCDPADRKFQQRTRRYAGFYMNEDPKRPTMIRSTRSFAACSTAAVGPCCARLPVKTGPVTRSSGGALFAAAWRTDYDEMIAHFQDYNDVVGDQPLNLCTTTLSLNAYALTEEQKYRDWTLEYIDAWVERTAANGGIIPTNIGLDGTIGGEAGGRWYGGVYGWGFTVTVPQTGELAHRTYFHVRALYGFGNALILTGDQRYVDTWRGVIDYINANAREIDGKTMWPNAYGDYFGEEDWYDWKPYPFHSGGQEVYYWSMNPDDLRLVYKNPWIDYLQGKNKEYPVEALQHDLDQVRRKVELMRADTTTPDARLSDDPNHINPATTEALTQLMLGGIPTGRTGASLHARLRYFDPTQRRPGIPEDVAALVEKMTADETVVTFVNVNQIESRTVVVQGGAYGEHQIEAVTAYGKTVPVDGASFSVHLEPGSGARLTLKMKRYANQPTFAFPWV
ncbi:MAG: hypothetical protein R3E79_22075 [Caldilineaceae bacterium]